MSNIRNAPTPRVVELVGFPGSGKTSIAKDALRQLVNHGHRRPFYYGKDGKLPFRIGHTPEAVALGSRMMVCAVMSGHIRELPRVAKMFENLLIVRRTRRYLGGEALVVFDQAVIQKLYLMRERDDPTREAMESVLELLKPELAEVYVIVDTPPNIAAERFAQRRKRSSIRPFKRWPADEVASLYRQQHRVLEWIVEWLECQEGTTVVRLDGRAPVQENGEIMAQVLKEFAEQYDSNVV